jgi:hypothetical protein
VVAVSLVQEWSAYISSKPKERNAKAGN